jgi:hypothetical protein
MRLNFMRLIYMRLVLFLVLAGLPLGCRAADAADDFRVLPYLQNPAPDAMTILWFSTSDMAGELVLGGTERVYASTPVLAEALNYPDWEAELFFEGQPPATPYRHRILLKDLEPNTAYTCRIEQGGSSFDLSFTTPPVGKRSIRFIAYADCETEPESSGKSVNWPDPSSANAKRLYLLDQTQGYANNLELIATRRPDFITISGDLVESGGEQRDWDEFWRHIANPDGPHLASQVPFFPAPGNHEYYAGPKMGGYDQPGSESAIGRFRTYFEFPPNHASDPEHEGRYYRIDYGPVTLIALDVANGAPHRSSRDTNFYLIGENDENGGDAPDFSPGSRQYAWLKTQLAEAQAKSEFTFVIFHHVPYSVGPHGWPPGEGKDNGTDQQSGVPVRALTPLFLRYGVDAVLAGHDETWERSELVGTEELPGGGAVPHVVHFFDVGTGGDGLRGPEPGLENPHQKFLAHSDAPEIWEDGVLIGGGKHYGHLEVDVLPLADGPWQAVLKPVYVFPIFDSEGAYVGYERRLYDDIVTLTNRRPTAVRQTMASDAEAFGLRTPFPNPFNSTVLIRYFLPRQSAAEVEIFNIEGQRVRRLIQSEQPAGYYSVEWNGLDEEGAQAASGTYVVKLMAGDNREMGKVTDTTKVTLVR